VVITAACLIATMPYQGLFLAAIGDPTRLVGAHSRPFFVLMARARGLYRTCGASFRDRATERACSLIMAPLISAPLFGLCWEAVTFYRPRALDGRENAPSHVNQLLDCGRNACGPVRS
jgi:hypothetical protein